MTTQLLPSPKSSAEHAQAFASLHKTIASFTKANKGEMGRGFAYNEVPSADLFFVPLSEFEEAGPEMIGINNDLYAQLVDLLRTYNIDQEYVSVIKIIQGDVTRFITQTGSLDEDAWQEIISEEEIKRRDAIALKARAAAHLEKLRSGRAKKKGKAAKSR
jgi:hypothetical protein